MSDNLEILIIQYLWRMVPKPVFLFTKKKKASSMKQAAVMDMFKKASNSVCTSIIVVLPDPLSPTP
jgi:hypothetical protein